MHKNHEIISNGIPQKLTSMYHNLHEVQLQSGRQQFQKFSHNTGSGLTGTAISLMGTATN